MILLKRFRYVPAIAFMVLALLSCDDDFNTIGGDLVDNPQDVLPTYEAGIVAYTKILPAVQTNNLSAHLFGVYQEPVYGLHTAEVLTQMSLSQPNPNFGNEPIMDSVVLTLPYYSTEIETDIDGNTVYRLDSIYGNAPFKLSITPSRYFINDYDPEDNFETSQKYFSDQGPLFEDYLTAEPLYVDESFRPSASALVLFQNDENDELDTISVSPRLRVKLPVAYFQQNILDKQGDPELSTNNNFRNFLRGLYFKAEPINGNGTMMLLDFGSAASEAGITLFYTHQVEDTADSDEDGDTDDMVGVQRSYTINFKDTSSDNNTNNIVNTFTQELPVGISEEISGQDEAIGAANLFLKGGEGSMAVIELFEDEEEIEELKSRNWLINEANLTFYVNQEKVQGGNAEPDRIYLFNLEDNTLLYDYSMDRVNDPTVTTHLPLLERDEDGNGVFYKVRITEHVRRILNEEDTNVQLGLVVTQNINLVNNAAVKEQVDGITRVPTGTVITPKGTVLHGNLSADQEKKLKFNIIYSEINN